MPDGTHQSITIWSHEWLSLRWLGVTRNLEHSLIEFSPPTTIDHYVNGMIMQNSFYVIFITTLLMYALWYVRRSSRKRRNNRLPQTKSTRPILFVHSNDPLHYQINLLAKKAYVVKNKDGVEL